MFYLWLPICPSLLLSLSLLSLHLPEWILLSMSYPPQSPSLSSRSLLPRAVSAHTDCEWIFHPDKERTDDGTSDHNWSTSNRCVYACLRVRARQCCRRRDAGERLTVTVTRASACRNTRSESTCVSMWPTLGDTVLDCVVDSRRVQYGRTQWDREDAHWS